MAEQGSPAEAKSTQLERVLSKTEGLLQGVENPAHKACIPYVLLHDILPFSKDQRRAFKNTLDSVFVRRDILDDSSEAIPAPGFWSITELPSDTDAVLGDIQQQLATLQASDQYKAVYTLFSNTFALTDQQRTDTDMIIGEIVRNRSNEPLVPYTSEQFAVVQGSTGENSNHPSEAPPTSASINTLEDTVPVVYTPEPHHVQEVEYTRAEREVAERLASEIRANGMGFIYGLFGHGMVDPSEAQKPHTFGTMAHQTIKGFIHGEAVPGVYLDYLRGMIQDRLNPSPTTRSQNQRIWQVIPYRPSTRTVSTTEYFDERGTFGRVKKVPKEVKHEELITWRDFHGDKDWKQYDYLMHLGYTDPQGRPLYADATFAVPPAIASKIDPLVEANPAFPDLLFKSMYPDMVKHPEEKLFFRKPATELRHIMKDHSQVVRDEIRPLPQPIPY